MMMTFPSAPAGATAADTTLPGANATGVVAPTSAPADGASAAVGLPLLFGQLLDMAGLTAPAAAAPAATEGDAKAEGAAGAAEGSTDEAPLAAMLPGAFNFTVLPVVQVDVAAAAAAAAKATAAGTPAADGTAGQVRNITLLGANADSARQAAADAITAAGRLVTDRAQQVAALPVAPVKADDTAQGNTRTALPTSTAASVSTASTAAPVTAVAQDAGLASDSNSRGDQNQQNTSFRGVMAASAPVAADQTATPDTVKLAGNPNEWQQPLRAALGDRLQMQLQRNSEHAVIRLDPPNLGSIEISIRHTAGALQVNLSASNSDVLRQLNTVSDNMRSDLSQRQFSDVAVTVSASNGRGLADGSGGGRRGEQEQQERGPGRALSEGDQPSSTFAMLTGQE
jgi:flagellar hook-length control protein FliK